MNLLSKSNVRNAVLLVDCTEAAFKFTLEPSNTRYARNGTLAKLVWDYSVDNQAELPGII